MRRIAPPIWLARPSRFAGLERRHAQLGLALLALLLLASLFAVQPGPSITTGVGIQDQTDIAVYDSIVEGIRHGGRYYVAAADTLRANDYPLKPFIAFPLPTLAVIEAAMPAWVVGLLLWALVAAVVFAWTIRLAPALARPAPRGAAIVLMAAGLTIFVQRDLAGIHELWAGLLVALSLALWRPGRWIESAAIGLAAALLCEAAAPYLIVMAAVALVEHRRREVIGWSLAIGILAVVLAFHAHAVAQVVRPLDPTSPGWTGMPGIGFPVHIVVMSTALSVVPIGLAGLLIGAALFGWLAWRDPLAVRSLAVILAYAAILATIGRTDAYYWELLVSPILLVGLVFAIDGVRDLFLGALDKRRITVTRVVR